MFVCFRSCSLKTMWNFTWQSWHWHSSIYIRSESFTGIWSPKSKYFCWIVVYSNQGLLVCLELTLREMSNMWLTELRRPTRTLPFKCNRQGFFRKAGLAGLAGWSVHFCLSTCLFHLSGSVLVGCHSSVQIPQKAWVQFFHWKCKISPQIIFFVVRILADVEYSDVSPILQSSQGKLPKNVEKCLGQPLSIF